MTQSSERCGTETDDLGSLFSQRTVFLGLEIAAPLSQCVSAADSVLAAVEDTGQETAEHPVMVPHIHSC